MKKGLQKLIPILIIISGFFTFGLSDLIWMYIVSDRLDYKRFLPMKQVALTVITFGVYGIFWMYVITSEMLKSRYLKSRMAVVLCTILSAVFLRHFSLFVIYRALSDNTSDAFSE